MCSIWVVYQNFRYNLMEQTWLVNPEERGNFEQIRLGMRSVLEEYTNQVGWRNIFKAIAVLDYILFLFY